MTRNPSELIRLRPKEEGSRFAEAAEPEKGCGRGSSIDPEALQEKRGQGYFAVALVAILGVALAPRLAHLDSSSYDLDEILQTYFVQGPWSFFWTKLTFDAVHPPLDYLVTRSIEALHPADWARRLPAVLWGFGTIAVLAILVRRKAGAVAGLVAALLLALAPFHVRYSQELRPYSLGLLLLCLSLLALDRLLERPSWLGLAGFYAAVLATAYTLYVAALALGIAAYALLLGEAFSTKPHMRQRARRFLALSPLFLLALLVAYLPWLPVVLTALRRPPPTGAPPLTPERFRLLLSFFSFAPGDGQPLRPEGLLYVAVVGTGLILALRRRRTRFFAVWLLGSWAAIEVLEQLHPHWYVPRHFLAAGLLFPIVAALCLAALVSHHSTRLLGALLITLFAVSDLRSLAIYYREGRPDWRGLGKYLRARPRSEVIFTNNQYSELCLGFYVVGPQFLYLRGHTTPRFVPLEGNALPIAWVWKPETTAWLVIAGGGHQYPELQEWSRLFPGIAFPRAEGAILRRLDPSLWGRMAETIPRPAS